MRIIIDVDETYPYEDNVIGVIIAMLNHYRIPTKVYTPNDLPDEIIRTGWNPQSAA